MEKIKLQVSGSQIQVVERPAAITAGTVGLEAEFSFDSHWENLGKTVIFRAGDKTITAALKGDTHIVPWEVMEKPDLWLIVGIYGANAEGTVVIPTLWTKVAAVYTGVEPEGDPALEPANPVWQQTLTRVANMEPQLQEHINNVNNPHGITCDQLGAVTQKEFRDVVSNLDGSSDPEGLIPHLLNRDNPHGITAAQAGAAPAGYGLGGAKQISATEIDSTTSPGWYYCNESYTVGDFSNNRWWMLVKAYSEGETFATQELHTFYNGLGYKLVRHKVNGAWHEWEWENPIMFLNEEYRTTERYKGKPVYAKMVDFGPLPATGYTGKDIVPSIDQLVRVDGSVYWRVDGHYWKSPLTVGEYISNIFMFSNKTLRLIVAKDLTGYYADAVVYYTKL